VNVYQSTRHHIPLFSPRRVSQIHSLLFCKLHRPQLHMQTCSVFVELTTSQTSHREPKTIALGISLLELRSKEFHNLYSSPDIKSRDSSVGMATGYGLEAEGWEFETRLGQDFSTLDGILTCSGVHPAFCPTCTGAFSPGVKLPGVKLTTHLQLAPKSIISGFSIHPLPHVSSWRSA
jgi:hypothetical protein